LEAAHGVDASDAVEVHDFAPFHRSQEAPPRRECEFLFTCEHAAEDLPPPFRAFPTSDQWIAGSHWAYDPGARDICMEVAQRTQSAAVLSKFSRLLIDPNRPLASDTLIRSEADGRSITMNSPLYPKDRDWRLQHYYLPFHLVLGAAANVVDPDFIVSIHSFNQTYEDETRDFEVGVLCTYHVQECRDVAAVFTERGFATRMNQPWSGREGFMYSADSLAAANPTNRKALMLEFRNDLAVNPLWRERAVATLADALSALKTT